MPERSAPPLHSEYRNDPAMAELVVLFAAGLRERARAIQHAFSARELATLASLAHQLRGSGMGYGFAVLGRAAGALEDALRAQRQAAAPDVEALAGHVQTLIAMCRRAASSVDAPRGNGKGPGGPA